MKQTTKRGAARALVGLGMVLGCGGQALVGAACSSGDDDSAAGMTDATASGDSGDSGGARGDGSSDGGSGGSRDGGSGGGGTGSDGGGGGKAPECDPSDAAVRTDPYRFPANGQGACTDEQLTQFTTCNSDTADVDASVAACAAVGAASFASCSACIYGTGLDAGVLSPLVVTTFNGGGHLALPDFGGCIAALDPAQGSCASASALSDYCAIDRCTGCTVSSAGDFAEVSSFFGCVADASATSCAGLQAQENDCFDALTAADSGAAPCLGLFDDAGGYSQVTFATVRAVCGAMP